MDAPDKIYLDIIEDDDIHMIAPSFKDNGGAEYIRKDALLDWLKNQQYESSTIVDDDKYQEVIEHINSM